jgi:hypothetical protein
VDERPNLQEENSIRITGLTEEALKENKVI